VTLLGPYEAPDNVLPGVIGGSARVATGYALKYGYRGAKRLARYVFRPAKPYTVTKAVRRGTGLGILGGLAGDFNPEGDLISPPVPIRQTPYYKQQRDRRRYSANRGCRCYKRRNTMHYCK